MAETHDPTHPRPLPGRNPEAARAFALAAAQSLIDDKCEDVLVLDLRGLSQVTDFFVIGSGTSDVQMRTAARDVVQLGEQSGFPPFRASHPEPEQTWIVVDCVDVVAHVFEPNTRAHYDLETLWDAAPRIDVPRRGPRVQA